MDTPTTSEELREQLQVGFDEADRGQVEEWDVKAFLAKMHERHIAANSAEGKPL
jgi:hypothetical protein